MRIERNGASITSVDTWFDLAPPKGGKDHWVSERSARELAEAWCGSGVPSVPSEFAALLSYGGFFSDVVIDRVFPEHKISFDDIRGEPRNADLAIEAHDRSGKLAITIEGKADESFDRPVAGVLETAVQRLAADKPTGAIRRIERLATMLPRWRSGLAHLGEIRYQLLTGVAGTLAWAKEVGAERGIFIVHEFVTSRTRPENHARNARDLDVFATRITDGRLAAVPSGVLIGPISIAPHDGGTATTLYIGKTTTVVQRA